MGSVLGELLAVHLPQLSPRPVRGLALLTCMDARIDLFAALGLAVGDAHLLRNAGGRATPDAIRSLLISTHVLGTREIGVLHHTDCGLEGRTNEQLADMMRANRAEPPELDFLPFADVQDSVRADVASLRKVPLPAGCSLWGAIFDVETGRVEVIVPD